MLNGRLRELTAPLTEDGDLVPVTTAESDGVRIYRRSLSFLLMTAAAEVFPGVEVSIEHSASTIGGYSLRGIKGRAPFTQAELKKVEARMRAIVDSDLKIARTNMSVAEAMALFHERGEEERVRLMAHREKETVVLHTLCGRQDYFQGYMTPSTGCLGYFALQAFPPGFLLQFPHQSRPTEIAPFVPEPKLFAVFEEAGHLLERLGVRSVGALNDVIASGATGRGLARRRGDSRGTHLTDRDRHRRAGRPGQGRPHRGPVLDLALGLLGGCRDDAFEVVRADVLRARTGHRAGLPAHRR